MTGTPAAAGAATADVMPGTTSNGDAGVEQRLGLLAAPTEHERVAALQADDPAPSSGPAGRAASRSAPGGRAAGPLADVDQLGGGGTRPAPLADQRVVHDDVGRGEQAGRLDRQQVGVARPGADERDGDRVMAPRRLGGRPAPADDRFGQPRGDRLGADPGGPVAERSRPCDAA